MDLMQPNQGERSGGVGRGLAPRLLLALWLCSAGCVGADLAADAAPRPERPPDGLLSPGADGQQEAGGGPAGWALSVGGDEQDVGEQLALLPGGDVVVVGRARVTSKLADGSAPGPGDGALLAARFNPAGKLQWALTTDSSAEAKLSAVAVDPQGNLVAAGYLGGAARIGEHTLEAAGPSDALLLKLSPAGDVLWVRTCGGSGQEQATGVTVDATGQIYVSGLFDSRSLRIGQWTVSQTTSPSSATFLAGFSAAGAVLWARSLGSGVHAVTSASLSRSGHPLLAGTYRDHVFVGDTVLQTTATGRGFFLAELKPDGGVSWASSFGSSAEPCHVGGLDVAPDGAIYLVGGISGAARLGNRRLRSAGGIDLFLARFAQDGALRWSVQLGGSDHDIGQAVVASAAGRVWVAGTFLSQALRVGGDELQQQGYGDVLLAEISSAGEPRGALSAGGAEPDWASSLALDATGNAYLTGAFNGTASFGQHPLGANSYWDLFLWQLPLP